MSAHDGPVVSAIDWADLASATKKSSARKHRAPRNWRRNASPWRRRRENRQCVEQPACAIRGEGERNRRREERRVQGKGWRWINWNQRPRLRIRALACCCCCSGGGAGGFGRRQICGWMLWEGESGVDSFTSELFWPPLLTLLGELNSKEILHEICKFSKPNYDWEVMLHCRHKFSGVNTLKLATCKFSKPNYDWEVMVHCRHKFSGVNTLKLATCTWIFRVAIVVSGMNFVWFAREYSVCYVLMLLLKWHMT
jgi:hypothetical protein